MFGVFAIDVIRRYQGTRFPGFRTLCHPGQGLVTPDQISTFFTIWRHTGHLLTQYHKKLTTTALCWLDTTKYQPLLSCIDAQLSQPDLVFFITSPLTKQREKNKPDNISCLGLSWNHNRVRDVNKIFSSRIWEFPDCLLILHQKP